VDSEAQAVGVGLPPRSGRGGPWREGDTQDCMPEPAGAIGIVGRKLDQWSGYGLSMAGARARFSSARDAPRNAVAAPLCSSEAMPFKGRAGSVGEF
jgi:hypothetical protein